MKSRNVRQRLLANPLIKGAWKSKVVAAITAAHIGNRSVVSSITHISSSHFFDSGKEHLYQKQFEQHCNKIHFWLSLPSAPLEHRVYANAICQTISYLIHLLDRNGWHETQSILYTTTKISIHQTFPLLQHNFLRGRKCASVWYLRCARHHKPLEKLNKIACGQHRKIRVAKMFELHFSKPYNLWKMPVWSQN